MQELDSQRGEGAYFWGDTVRVKKIMCVFCKVVGFQHFWLTLVHELMAMAICILL